MQDILVTDTLFVLPENERTLEQAGYRVVRLEKLKATEEELISSLQGKVGYILGGIERVTDSVVNRAHSLKAIAFTGSNYRGFIPGWESAIERGIRITAAPGANAQSVAEFSISLALPLLRNVFALSAIGGSTSFTGREFGSQTALVVGHGCIGRIVANILKGLGFRVIVAAHPSVRPIPDCEVQPIDAAVALADLITLHVSPPRGDHVLNEERLHRAKEGAVIVNAAYPEAIEVSAAVEQARSGRLRFAFDEAPRSVPNDLPHGSFVTMNAQSGFLTKEAVKRTSDRVTTSIINILSGRSDPDEIRVR